METFVALDVAIGLAFVYLLLSLICTAMNEWVATIFRLRAQTFRRAVHRLLDAPDAPPTGEGPAAKREERLSDRVMTHALIRSIADHRGTPAYVPARRFVAALKDTMASTASTAGTTGSDTKAPDSGDRRTRVQSDATHVMGQIQALRNVRRPSASNGGGAIDDTDEVLMEWFNDGMERASGWYKRQILWITLGTAALVTVISNADTLVAARILWHDPTTRSAVVALAQERAKHPRPAESGAIQVARYPDDDRPVIDPGGAQVKPIGAQTPAAAGAPANPTPTERVSEDDEAKDTDAPAVAPEGGLSEDEKAALAQLMGWSREFRATNASVCVERQRVINRDCKAGSEASPECRASIDAGTADGRCVHGGSGLEPTDHFAMTSGGLTSLALPHLPGWLITIVAISLGAPFWFDTLQRIINIRGGGKNPEPKTEKGGTKVGTT
jgi:hypothetical protein